MSLSNIPDELLIHIFLELPWKTIISLFVTSKRWSGLLTNEVYELIAERDFPGVAHSPTWRDTLSQLHKPKEISVVYISLCPDNPNVTLTRLVISAKTTLLNFTSIAKKICSKKWGDTVTVERILTEGVEEISDDRFLLIFPSIDGFMLIDDLDWSDEIYLYQLMLNKQDIFPLRSTIPNGSLFDNLTTIKICEEFGWD